MKEGILLLGHGSRREEANEVIRDICELMRKKYGDKPYEVGYLSFGRPDIGEAVKNLVETGVKRIIVAPLFLVTGNHIKEDIPNEILIQKDAYPEVEFLQAGHLGADPRIADIVMERVKSVSQSAGEE